MRCVCNSRLVALATAVGVAILATGAMAASYSGNVSYNGTSLFFRIDEGKNGTCVEATLNGDGTFAYSFTADDPTKANLKFFKNNTCSSEASRTYKVSDLLGTEDAETNLSISSNKNITTLREPDPDAKSSSSSAKSSSSVKSSSSTGGFNPGTRPTSSSSKEEPAKDGKNKKVIAFLTPWSNTNAILYLNATEQGHMTSLKNKCGWFTAAVTAPTDDFKVYFKQTIGKNYVGMDGMVDVEPTNASMIVLDTIAALTDTIWVQGYKNDIPSVTPTYPGVLGPCPSKVIPVMMFDWYDGSSKSGRNGYVARDVPQYGTGVSEDFGSDGCGGSPMTGMVEKVLGANEVPQRAADFPKGCTNATHLDNWFIPEFIGKDKNGKSYTNATCRNLDLTMTDDGLWLGQKDDSSPEGGFFLLDDFRWLDKDSTVENIYYDSADGNKGYHNFGLTMMFKATFEYVRGQEFTFNGDDDVWVFINNQLVIDIGGQHTKIQRSVKLDDLDLTEGETYPFHIFYAERKRTQSNFMMTTSIDLQTDASMFLKTKQNMEKLGVKDYEVWQINKTDGLSCDFTAAAKTDLDTTSGPSTFRLTGAGLAEPVDLDIGVHYDGLNIKTPSSFSIDSVAIVDSDSLAPGHYFLEITLKSDPTQITKVEIIIPARAIPTVALANDKWEKLGQQVSGDTLQIGKWTYASYPVNITFLEEWATVMPFNSTISITSSSPYIEILDKNERPIKTVTLDSDAHATFYVRATKEITDGAILLQVAQATTAPISSWMKLTFTEPPVPYVVDAIMRDRNGDGIGDSLYVKFNKQLDDQRILDSLQFTFGETFNVVKSSNIKISGSKDEISIVSATSCPEDSTCGFSRQVFTGGDRSIYTGKIVTWFTYVDGKFRDQFKMVSDSLKDGVEPIVIKAVKKKMEDGNRELTITFSEAISASTRNAFAKMFEYTCYRSGSLATPEDPVQQSGSNNTMVLIFGSSTEDAVYPDDGDLIRFVPGVPGSNSVAKDLLGNMPHKNNPWAPIKGDQEVSNDSPGLITVSIDNPIVANPQTTQPILITDPKLDAQAIGEQLGVQGNLIDFDISKIMTERTMDEIEALDAFIATQTGPGKADTTYEYTQKSTEEALQEVFAYIATGNIGEAYGISEELASKIISNDITMENYKNTASSEEVKAIDQLVKQSVDRSRDSIPIITPATEVSYEEVFNKIASGEISEAKLKEAGISDDVIKAIKKDKTLTASNVGQYRNGSLTLVSADAVRMSYRTRYYSHLGGYVGGTSGSIGCTDSTVYEGNCLEHSNSKVFLAWNMRADDGRLAATGVYIARLELKIYVNDETILDQTRDKLWGVRRGKPGETKSAFNEEDLPDQIKASARKRYH